MWKRSADVNGNLKPSTLQLRLFVGSTVLWTTPNPATLQLRLCVAAVVLWTTPLPATLQLWLFSLVQCCRVGEQRSGFQHMYSQLHQVGRDALGGRHCQGPQVLSPGGWRWGFCLLTLPQTPHDIIIIKIIYYSFLDSIQTEVHFYVYVYIRLHMTYKIACYIYYN